MARLALLLLALACSACFQAKPSETAGGGGVETTEGNLAALSGSPAGARVTVIPAAFDAARDTLPDSLTAIADAAGNFRIRGLVAGLYNIESAHPATGARCFRAGVRLGKGERIGTDTLEPPGRARLRWDGARKGLLTQRGRAFRLSLAGLESDSGGILLDSLPAGTLPPYAFRESPADTAAKAWTDSVAIASGAQSEIPAYGEWAHQALLEFDPPAGAGDSLAGFPLLVRLARPAFDFGEAAADGSDLRFTTPAGEPLAYALERWDPAAGNAEVWVRLKTARRGAGPQALVAHWGNPGARAPSGAAAVFDTAAGWLGVWHMDAEGPGKAGLRDATPNGLRTILRGTETVPPGSEAIGPGRSLDGVGGYAYGMNTDAVKVGGSLHLSAWIAPVAPGLPGPRTILAKWEEIDSAGWILDFPGEGPGIRLTLGLTGGVFRMDALPPAYAHGEWHHVAATFDGTEAALWWDGALLARQATASGALPATARDIVIGARGSADPEASEIAFFPGRIDEARFGRIPRGADWIRLETGTQRPGSGALRFQKIK